jgi:hypothetical protein
MIVGNKTQEQTEKIVPKTKNTSFCIMPLRQSDLELLQ